MFVKDHTTLFTYINHSTALKDDFIFTDLNIFQMVINFQPIHTSQTLN